MKLKTIRQSYSTVQDHELARSPLSLWVWREGVNGVVPSSRRISMTFGFRSGRLRSRVLWARLKDDAIAIVVIPLTLRSPLRWCLERFVRIDILLELDEY